MDIPSYLLGKKAGGGGGGTTDYSQLTNKPSINGVTLSGDKTTEDLGISANVPQITIDTQKILIQDTLDEVSEFITNNLGKVVCVNVVDGTIYQSTGYIQVEKIFNNFTPQTNEMIAFGTALNTVAIQGSWSGDTYTVSSMAVASLNTNNGLSTTNTSVFVPTSNYQPATKKYVDDNTFSGNYNDLTNKPTIPDDSELLHYKGHCASEGDLPSLGQPSGSLISPALSVTDVDAFSEKWLNPFKCSQDRIDALLNDTTMSTKRTGYTYYILGATCTTQDGSEIKGRRLVIAYNNPSQVEIQMLYSNNSWNGMYLFSINASVSEPVYVYTTPATEYQSSSDKLRHWTSSSYDDSVLDTAITSPMVLQGGYTYVDGRKRCIYFSNQIKYSGNVADVLDLTINDLTGLDSYFKAGAYQSIQFTNDNYIWNDDMIFLLPTVANTVQVQYNTTTTKLNDTYTVGSNYDIYRRNESTQWDKFSKAPDVVTTISSSSTNSDVPSALAVYNYVNSLNGNGVSY